MNVASLSPSHVRLPSKSRREGGHPDRQVRAITSREQMQQIAMLFDHLVAGSSVAGTFRPSVFTVLRLMTNSTLVGMLHRQVGGCSSPLRIRSTYEARLPVQQGCRRRVTSRHRRRQRRAMCQLRVCGSTTPTRRSARGKSLWRDPVARSSRRPARSPPRHRRLRSPAESRTGSATTSRRTFAPRMR